MRQAPKGNWPRQPVTIRRLPTLFGEKGNLLMEKNLNTSWWSLRLVYGVIPVVAGLDKFFNLLTDWQQYLGPLLRNGPLSPATLMHIVGVIEIAAGIAVLTRATKYAAYVVSVWLVCIALNLLTSGKYLDVAARDVAMAAGAFVLARLSEARQSAASPAISSAPLRTAHAG